MQPIRRINLEAISNCRDLGGYACNDGATCWHVFYRSAKLYGATQYDIKKLAALHIKQIVDLRTSVEAALEPDCPIPGAAYSRISLLGNIDIAGIAINSQTQSTKTLFRMYRKIITHSGPQVVKAITLLAQVEGPALFHCAAGKDRTGIVAMFLLAAAGVPPHDIIADYAISEHFLKGKSDDISGSNASNMERLLLLLQKEYGGPLPYLQACGLSSTTLCLLKEKFAK